MPLDLLLICRDALASSLVSNLIMAMEAQKVGQKVGILFHSEALSALGGNGTFLWPRELREQEVRLRMADQGRASGLPLAGRGESRQLNVWEILRQAQEAQVPMFACPLWTGLLGLQGKLPQGIQEIDLPAALKMLREAHRVVGSF